MNRSLYDILIATIKKIQNPDLDPGSKNPGFIQIWINPENPDLDSDPGFIKKSRIKIQNFQNVQV